MSSLPLPIAAFLAGLLSFLSPCVLPLVPGYVSLISGTGAAVLEGPGERRPLLGKVMLHSLAFIVGFSVVFIALGAAASEVGRVLLRYRGLLTYVAGVVIIVFGLHLTGLIKIKALYADKRLHEMKGGGSALGAFLVGFAFAFGWTPCIGPILAGILTIAAGQNTVTKGVLLLAVYSAGLAVPFLLTSLGLDLFMSFYGRFRQHLHKVEVASGVLLIVLGALVLTSHLTVLSSYLSFLNRFAL